MGKSKHNQHPALPALPQTEDLSFITHTLTRIGLLLLAVFLAYMPAMRGGFIWDDDFYVTGNLTLRTLEGLRRIWLEPGAVPQYYPLAHTTFWLEYRLWKLAPLGYHVVNIALHSLNALLVWRVLRKLAIPGAYFAALLFALHPVHVESVAWITERKNVLSGLFYLSSLFLYLRWAMPDAGQQNGHTPTIRFDRFYTASFLLFLCALLSKTVTCSLPAAILLILWWKRDKLFWKDAVPLLPFFISGFALSMGTIWMEKHVVDARGADWVLSWPERCLIAGRALWFYAGKILWPDPLIFIYPRWQMDTDSWRQLAYPLSAISAVTALWYVRAKTGKGPLTAILFFAVTLFPALGFIDIYPMRYSFVADHFQYLASLGLIALAAALVQAGFSHAGRAFKLTVQTIVLTLLATLTWRQCFIYKDLETLWKDTATKNPGAFIAQSNLGMVLCGQGKLQEGVEHFRIALTANPKAEETYNNLGLALSAQGRLYEALGYYRKALELRPSYAEARSNLGVALNRKGDFPGAVAQFAEAIRLKPDYPVAHSNLGLALIGLGQLAPATAHLRQAVTLSPDYAEAHYNLGLALARQGNMDEAILSFSRVLELTPSHLPARINLGAALAQRRLERAIAHFREALKFDPSSEQARRNLALALNQLNKK